MQLFIILFRFQLSNLHNNVMETHILFEEDIIYVPTNIYETEVYIGMSYGQYMVTDFSSWGVRLFFF